MTTTLAEMHAEVKLAHGNRSDIETQIDAWLNQAQRSFVTNLNIREVEAGATLVLNPSQTNPDIYALPGDFFVPMLLVNVTQDRQEIKLRNLDVILAQIATPANNPAIYALRGLTMVLRPQPSTADTVELTYRIRPAAMTSGVDMTLPDEFMYAVIFDASARGFLIQNEEARAGVFTKNRDSELAMIGNQRSQEMFAREDGAVLGTGFQSSASAIRGVR